MTTNKLNISLTMRDLYGDNVLYTSRPSYGFNPWLQPEEHQSNLLSARELIIAEMPVIVHKATVTEKTCELFGAAGVAMPKTYITYETREEYEKTLKEYAETGKIFFQYAHETDIVDNDDYVVPRDIFLDLNNKSLIHKWTGGEYLPKREIVKIDDFQTRVREWPLPFVVKPGDEHPTAGGYGVMLCYTEEDVENAIERVQAASGTEQLIIEQFVEPIKNYCVQYAYSEEKGITFLGASLQMVEKYGKYRGNTTDRNVPESVIEAGRKIMENGVDAGYKGIAGFDILVDKDDNLFAIDLNFRQNGSSSLLLLDDVLKGDYKKFLAYYSDGDNAVFYETILNEVKSGNLFPLAYYDGDYRDKNAFPSRFICIWYGEDEAFIDQKAKRFEQRLKGEVHED